MTAFDSIWGTDREIAESMIARHVAASRKRMDDDEARLIAEVEAYVAHPSQGRRR